MVQSIASPGTFSAGEIVQRKIALAHEQCQQVSQLYVELASDAGVAPRKRGYRDIEIQIGGEKRISQNLSNFPPEIDQG